MTTMEERVGRLEGAFQQFDQRLGDIQARLERIETRMDNLETSMNARIDQMGARIDNLRTTMDARMEALEARVNAQFRTAMIIMSTGGIAIAGAIVTLAFRM